MEVAETRYARRDDGVSIAYQVIGDGPVDLVYVPGFVSHLDLMWGEPGFVRLAKRLTSFARLIAFDKPGTGLSDPIPYVPTMEERANDVRVVMDAAGVDSAVLMGFSEGGPQSVLFAATWPERVRALVLYGAFAAGRFMEYDDVADLASKAEYDAMKERWERDFVRVREVQENWGQGLAVGVFAPSVANDVTRRVWAAYERSAASPAMAAGLIEAVLQADVRSVLSSVQAPTLVLHRTGDVVPVLSGRFLASRIPDARMVELPGDDHAFWLGDVEPFIGPVEEFVTGARHEPDPERVLGTVLFSDIVASTETAARLGDGPWRELLEQHDRLARREVEQAGGRVIKTMGDGFLAMLDGPARAVRCAEAIRDSVAELGIQLRAGVHTGEVELIGEDVGGMAVHIGARVCAEATPGEVWVSGTVHDLVVGSQLRFVERGVRALKGVPGEWRLYAVGDAGPQGDMGNARDNMRLMDKAAVQLARRAPGALRAVNRLARRSARA